MQSRLVVFVLPLLISACDKKDAAPTTAPSASVSAAVTASAAPTESAPTPSATAATSATPEPTTEGPAVKAASKDAGGSATPTASASSGGGSGAGECGTKPLPDCPLQAWMKSNANPPVMTSDTAKLAPVLDKIGAMAPPGYTNWASISKDGATAARANDLAGAKASCRTCHDQYKTKYKNELRTRKI